MLRADVEGDEHWTLVGQGFTGKSCPAPEWRGIGDIGLAEPALRPLLRQLPMFGGQRGSEFDEVPMLRWDRDNDVFDVHRALFAGDRDVVVVVIDAPHGGFHYDAVAEFGRCRIGDLLRAGRETVLLGT